MTLLAAFGWLCLALILFAIPGWGILAWLFPSWERLSFFEKIPLSIGFSFSLYPLFYLYTDIVGIHLGWMYPFGLVVIGTSLLIWREYRLRKLKYSPKKYLLKTESNNSLLQNAIIFGKAYLPEIALLGVLALAAFTRFWPVRNIEVPMWGDSYQHSLITQLLVDNRGLFQTWYPYAELQTFTYHFGLHTLAASFQQVTGLTAYQSILWFGQILNLLALLALYPLATRVGSSKWAGVAAIIIAGFFSPMPMFYTNWGRYTQLAGQVILPVAVFLIMNILDSGSFHWRPTVIIWLILAGLGLTHYLVLIFAGLFYFAYLITGTGNHRTVVIIKQALWQTLGAGLILLPWLVRLFQGKLPLIFSRQIAASAERIASSVKTLVLPGDLETYLPAFLWLILLLSLGWGLWRRNRQIALISVWWLLIIFTANLKWFGLPGTDSINNFAVLIAFYIPAGIITGESVGYIITDKVHPRFGEGYSLSDKWSGKSNTRPWLRIVLWVFLAVLAGAACLWGARQRVRDIKPAQYSLVTPQDMSAIAWMKENLANSPRFLVNSFFAYGDTLIAGSDAGWWLPLLAGQQTTLPPLNYGMEQGPFPEYRQWINELTAIIQAKGIDDPQVLDMLAERGVTHVYIGQQEGKVNNAHPLITVESLIDSPHYQQIFNLDQVRIFEFIYP